MNVWVYYQHKHHHNNNTYSQNTLLQDFEAFASTPKAAALFAQLDITAEEVRDKARVMGVGALAASKPHLTFADVQVSAIGGE